MDGIILQWYKLNVDITYDGEKWSKINDIKKYQSIVSKIRTYCKNENIIEQEFIIWESENKKEKNKQLLACANKIIKSPQSGQELQSLLEEYSTTIRKEMSCSEER